PVLSLSAIARPTPILHHQIRNRTGKHRIFARSVREDDQNLAVAGLYSSAMAGSIDRVIARIEREWPSDNHRVSVVAIPAHNTTVLWVRSADDAAVYVVAHPRTAHVRTGQKYTEAAFVARLRGRAAATARLRRSELPERSKPR
ncbi:MAG TPA: hypothetical protein VK669_10410, partial [Candidatus Limnocylindrales bacterium]|nr:hypothetical protein [Candidatus Limnocylindrales bacterium]